MKTCTFTFARMNPITLGHIETVVKTIAKQPGEKRIYLSHTQDKKSLKNPLKNKNPLPYEEKLRFATLAVKDSYPKVQVIKSDCRTILEVLRDLYQEGFEKIFFVVGSDRLDAFKSVISTYNGQFNLEGAGYYFKEIEYICAGERIDSDDNSIQALSASKLRELAINNNFEEFFKSSPFKNKWIAEEEFILIRQYML